MSELSEKDNRFNFEISGSGAKTDVVEATLSETVSMPYQADLVLASEDVIGLQDVIGKEALLTIIGATDDRLIHGVISRFAQTGKRGRFLIYEARLVPHLWLLSQTRNSQIFQGDAVKDIITKILKDDQISSEQSAFRLKGKYQPLDYAVEYQESDLAFISRLSEEDGIWYFFEQSKDKDVVVFADSPSAYKPIEGTATVPFKEAEGMPPTEEVVYQLTAVQSIVPGKMSQNDFNYTKPSTALATQEQAKSNTALEIYEHPGRYQDEDTGKRLTKTRLEELNAMGETIQGLSTCPRLAPGYTFTLEGHETSAFNQEYLIISVTHHGKEPQALQETASPTDAQSYYNEFTAIPSSVTLRPARTTPRPTIVGPQTAIVVGAQGEEIYTDDSGRIKVKFHWDRADEKNEKSSCWIRVGQLWTGEGWGSMFIPRVGQEVIVSFMDGDPDRPIVTGRVYNGKNPPPHALPASKTQSTIMTNSSKGGGGSNELTFEDAKGSENITLHGQKDLTVNVGNDKNESVGNNETNKIKANLTRSVGGDSTNTVTGNETYTVVKDDKRTVSGGQTLSVTGHRKKTVTAGETVDIKAGQTITITGDKNETVTGPSESTVTATRTVVTNGAKVETTKLASMENVGLAKALSIGAAYQISVVGVMNETVGGAKAEEVGKIKAVVVGGKMSEMVGGGRSMTAAGTHTIKATEFSVVASSAKITLQAGDATITMKEGNIDISGKKITINGDNITVNGSSSLTMKGDQVGTN